MLRKMSTLQSDKMAQDDTYEESSESDDLENANAENNLEGRTRLASMERSSDLQTITNMAQEETSEV